MVNTRARVLKPFCTGKKKFHVQCIIYDQPENVRSLEQSIFSLSISLHFSLSLSLNIPLDFSAEKYLRENSHNFMASINQTIATTLRHKYFLWLQKKKK